MAVASSKISSTVGFAFSRISSIGLGPPKKGLSAPHKEPAPKLSSFEENILSSRQRIQNLRVGFGKVGLTPFTPSRRTVSIATTPSLQPPLQPMPLQPGQNSYFSTLLAATRQACES
mmetsp:Transcript_9350/g.17218  ORF Transcript_9350/g.17218 Transcript_9350/m.17218 type:complete len:117 (+) Transcript_9350:2567-2917(+)